jgi:rSAM/selenodomain-associated transferase 1
MEALYHCAMTNVCAVIVFARAPVPGQVKTRLIPALGPLRAAALHRRLVRETLTKAVRSGVGPVTLAGYPSAGHPFFARCATRYGVALMDQEGADLGARMGEALKRALDRAPMALLVGSDCPPLTVEDLRAAARALGQGADAVLAPAEDGGYVLIGLRCFHPALFCGLPWGSEGVLRETMGRLERLSWRVARLPTRWDLDRPEDFARLRALRGAWRSA